MLDKNPEINLNDDLNCIQNEFKNNVPSLVLCLNSFHKIEFLDKLISSRELASEFTRISLKGRMI